MGQRVIRPFVMSFGDWMRLNRDLCEEILREGGSPKREYYKQRERDLELWGKYVDSRKEATEQWV